MPKYQRLTQRDTIEKGDEIFTNWGTWEPVDPEYVGCRKGKIYGWYVKIRRLVDES